MASPTTQPRTTNTNTNTTTTKPAMTAQQSTQLRAMTEKMAYELWEKSGRKHGNDVQNWVEAEKICRQKLGY
jgi:hypothetical protein